MYLNMYAEKSVEPKIILLQRSLDIFERVATCLKNKNSLQYIYKIDIIVYTDIKWYHFEKFI